MPHLTLSCKNSLSAPKISLALLSFTHSLVTTTMDEPISTPPYANVTRAASVLATALPNNYDTVYPSVDTLNPTVLFPHHYDAHGGNIFSLTPEFISNGNNDPVDKSLKRSLPNKLTCMVMLRQWRTWQSLYGICRTTKSPTPWPTCSCRQRYF